MQLFSFRQALEGTERTKRAIMQMSYNVIEALAGNLERVKKEVCGTMGGRILEYEAKSLRNKGREDGLELTRILLLNGKQEELLKAAEDEDYRDALMREYGIG